MADREREERRRRRERPIVEVDLDDDGDADVALQSLADDGISVSDLRDILRNVDRIDIIRLLAIILRRRA